MTYNADGSEYYNIASTLKKIFEEKYAKTVREPDGEFFFSNVSHTIQFVSVCVVYVIQNAFSSTFVTISQ
jgi:hypothetical protein